MWFVAHTGFERWIQAQRRVHDGNDDKDMSSTEYDGFEQICTDNDDMIWFKIG